MTANKSRRHSIRKHPLAIPNEVIDSGKEYQWMLNPSGKMFLGAMMELRKKIQSSKVRNDLNPVFHLTSVLIGQCPVPSEVMD